MGIEGEKMLCQRSLHGTWFVVLPFIAFLFDDGLLILQGRESSAMSFTYKYQVRGVL